MKAPSCRPRTSPLRIARFLGEGQVRWIVQKDRKSVGRWMKEELTLLGPAFIKLGQFFSTRPDIFGTDAVTELARLQDDITAEPFESIQWVIQESLGPGQPMENVFSEIDPVSIASASIGQVHKAVLKDGTPVVIKVQKSCVARQIQEDIETLRSMNQLYELTGSARALEFQNVLNQYESFLSAELDYVVEMEHMMKFRDLLEGLPVRIPRVYPQFSSRNLLVMEYVPSTKITDLPASVDSARIADALVEVFLYQIISLGYIHCDPHPGNIGVLADGETIVLYDFGNVIKLSPEFRKEIQTLIFSIFQRDVDDFVQILEKLKILEIRDDIERLEIKEFFRSFFVYLETVDFEDLKASILQQGAQGSAADIKIRIDPDFLALFRVFSLLDGTCVRLDPNFNYIESLQPYAQDIIQDRQFLVQRVQKDWNKLRAFPMAIRSTDDNMLRLHKRVSNMNETIQRFQILSILLLCLPTEDTSALVLACVATSVAYKSWDRFKDKNIIKK